MMMTMMNPTPLFRSRPPVSPSKFDHHWELNFSTATYSRFECDYCGAAKMLTRGGEPTYHFPSGDRTSNEGRTEPKCH